MVQQEIHTVKSPFCIIDMRGGRPRVVAEYMEAILVKVFATALALSLVMTRPDAVKTEFDPVTDKAEVLKILGRRLRRTCARRSTSRTSISTA